MVKHKTKKGEIRSRRKTKKGGGLFTPSTRKRCSRLKSKYSKYRKQFDNYKVCDKDNFTYEEKAEIKRIYKTVKRIAKKDSTIWRYSDLPSTRRQCKKLVSWAKPSKDEKAREAIAKFCTAEGTPDLEGKLKKVYKPEMKVRIEDVYKKVKKRRDEHMRKKKRQYGLIV
jgi:hypothetical protein